MSEVDYTQVGSEHCFEPPHVIIRSHRANHRLFFCYSV